uniref:RING-type domain-containing protein n=1 Tax=viral metagenome TaxID=1070528 RepID=A0A6C0BAR0_9ZZZZ
MSGRNHLTNDQRVLLDIYVNLYSQNSRQIERMLELQQEITNSIVTLTNNRRNVSQTTPRNRGTYYDEATGRIYINGLPYRIDYFNNESRTANSTADSLWGNFENLYSNIVVRPTAEQIRVGTRNIIFLQIPEPLNASCPISLEPFQEGSQVTQIIGCGHLFHPANAQEWFDRNVRCPICRYDIRTQIRNTPLPEETKEEGPLEETKEGETVEEDNRHPRPIIDMSNNVLVNELTQLTETILGRFFNANSRVQLNSENSQMTYDASRNEIVFQGFY